MLVDFIIISLVVGVITAFINVRYDRFFILLLAIFLFGYNIDAGVEILLWTIFFGSFMIITENADKIRSLPRKEKVKMFIIVPSITLVSSFIGSYLFSLASNKVLLITLAIITLIYSARMIFVHFKPEEMNYKPEPGNKHEKLCTYLGPFVSGLTLGFIGTSLKAIKIPCAVKRGKLNMQKVYLFNTITAAFGSGFALLWHNLVFVKTGINDYFEKYFILAAALWTVIHFVAKITSWLVRPHWQKISQIVVGVFLLVAFVKILMLINA